MLPMKMDLSNVMQAGWLIRPLGELSGDGGGAQALIYQFGSENEVLIISFFFRQISHPDSPRRLLWRYDGEGRRQDLRIPFSS